MDGGAGGGSESAPTHACAACKHQRRKCARGCPMARYFPASRAQEFRDVHRLFGLSNLTKAHNNLPPGEERDTAVKTMIFEAGMRRADPIHGAYGVVRSLHMQIEAVSRELDAVLRQLAIYRWEEQRRTPLNILQPRCLTLPLHSHYPPQIRSRLKPLPLILKTSTMHHYDEGSPPISSRQDHHFDSKDQVT